MTRLRCVRQRDTTDCGAACLATICAQYGAPQPLGRLRALSGTDAMGATALGLVRAATSLGFTAEGLRGTVDDLVTSPDVVLPAIAHITTPEGLLHFVVVHRLDRRAITVADPAHGIRTLSLAEFAACWSGTLIVLAPPPGGFPRAPRQASPVRQFIGPLAGQARPLVLISGASVLVTAIGIVGAFYLKAIIDQIVPRSLGGLLTTVSLAVVGLYVVRVLLDADRSHLVLHVQRRIDARLVLSYYHHVTRLPLSFFGTRRTGDILARFEDAGRIREALAAATVTVFVDVLMSLGGCFILATQDTVLFALAAVLAGLHGVLGLMVARPIHRLNQDLMEANATVTSHFVESIVGAETVKAYNAQARMAERADSLYGAYLSTAFRQGRWQNLQRVASDALGTLGTVVIVWAGAGRVLDGALSVGGLVVFVTLLDYFLNPVRNLLDLQPALQAAAVAAHRLGDVLALDEEPLDAPGQVDLRRLSQPITLDDVRFRYGARRPVLDGLSLTIPPGASVGLVGESGSGKTTVAKLLTKLYAPESGQIWYGGAAIDALTASSLRERVAYIAQDTAFFSGTIADNLKLARPDATPEQVIRAARMADAHDFIAAMPGRYQTMLEEDAANLSGGQRQRLAIAQALLRGAGTLILDEATSHLDSLSERAVSDTVARLGGITRLVIAHRLSTVAACDVIYVMADGRVVESGTHAELLALGGTYRRLWRAQYPEAGRGSAPDAGDGSGRPRLTLVA